MNPTRLDHVAFWVADRDTIAERCRQLFGMHVIDRSDKFTLIGTDARHGKLTLFEAVGPRERGAFVRVGLRVSDLATALAQIPDGRDTIDVGEGITIRLVEGETPVEYDIDHVALLTPNPEATAAAYERLGFARRRGEERLEVGTEYVELLEGDVEPVERPLLNHLAVLVDSSVEHEEEARREGIGIDSVVDAENTRAVFLWAPDDVRIEYVEHKATFSLI
jgi:catechol 2,3-dioxygenase-like lactoylglutathione lyase family enzyme